MTALVALVLTTAAFTVPTRQALAWGFFGNGIKLDQQINQLNKCTNHSSEGRYDQQSYDMSSNQPTTESSGQHNTDKNQTSTDSGGNHASAGNQTTASASSIEHGTDSGNNKNSNNDGDYNNKPSDNNGGNNDNNKPSSSSVLCSNKATNLATIG